MSNIRIYVISHVLLSIHLAWQKLWLWTLHANFSTRCFHTCHAYWKCWLLPFCTTFNDLDLGRGSQGQRKVKPFSFIFLLYLVCLKRIIEACLSQKKLNLVSLCLKQDLGNILHIHKLLFQVCKTSGHSWNSSPHLSDASTCTTPHTHTHTHTQRHTHTHTHTRTHTHTLSMIWKVHFFMHIMSNSLSYFLLSRGRQGI